MSYEDEIRRTYRKCPSCYVGIDENQFGPGPLCSKCTARGLCMSGDRVVVDPEEFSSRTLKYEHNLASLFRVTYRHRGRQVRAMASHVHFDISDAVTLWLDGACQTQVVYLDMVSICRA